MRYWKSYFVNSKVKKEKKKKKKDDKSTRDDSTEVKKLRKRRAKEQQVSISPTFYEKLFFVQKCFSLLFSNNSLAL